MHHQRLLNSGDPEKTKRADDWGAIEKHPLRNRWRWMKRHQALHPYVPEWDDFLTFVMDVGEPPHSKAKLYVANDQQPLGPGNFVWKRVVTEPVEGEDEATYQRRRARAYRHLDKERYADYDLKKNYGISREQRAEMEELHGGVCAICKEPESSRHFSSLSIDHCHTTGKIRGLLCANCNRALGLMNDSALRLEAAAAYLRRT